MSVESVVASEAITNPMEVISLELQKRNSDKLKSAPLLTRAAVADVSKNHHRTYKWQAIIRDVQDPELILSNDEGSEYKERLPLRCVVLPAQSEWFLKQQRSSAAFNSQVEVLNPAEENSGDTVNNATKKRGNNINPEDEAPLKKSKENSCNNTANNNDVLKPKPFECIVYTYENTKANNDDPESSSPFKVNQTFEFLAVLDLLDIPTTSAAEGVSGNITLDDNNDDTNTMLNDTDDDAFVPRLHCIEATPIGPLQLVLKDSSSSSSSTFRTWEGLDTKWSLQEARDLLLTYLAESVLQNPDDKVSATYLLLSLIARVHARPDTGIGALPLNLICTEEDKATEFVSSLVSGIESIVPLMSVIPLSIDKLNSSDFAPVKNYDRNRLEGGELQLADGTTVVVNEFALTEGKLNEAGLKNVAHLTKAVHQQVLGYDFGFYAMDFPIDLNFILVSPTKSFIKSGIRMPVQAKKNDTSSEFELTSELLECFRLYLAVVRQMTFKMDEKQSLLVQKYFVEKRRVEKSITAEHLHEWLTMARLLSLSHGSEGLTEDLWNQMTELEKARTDRLVV